MRHRVYGKHLGRDKNQRTALFRSLVGNLILHESIETTQPKAQAIKGLVDTLVVKSKQDSESSRRHLTSFLVQSTLIQKLTKEIAPRYNDRNSGFTTTVKLGTRQGDGAMVVKMSFVPGGQVKLEKPEKVNKLADQTIQESEEIQDKPKKAPRAKKEAK